MLFSADSIWNWNAEKNFARLKAEGGVPERRSSVFADQRRRSSLAGSSFNQPVQSINDKGSNQNIESKV
jgi:hypothetical protein